MTAIKLPSVSGGLETFTFSGKTVAADKGEWNRSVFAAAHVVVDASCQPFFKVNTT